MISDSTVELLLDLVYAVLANQYTVGYPGKSDGSGGWNIYVVNDPGRVWVRIWDGENVTVTKATAIGRTALDPSLRVLMRRVNGELIIDLPDPAAARQLYGFYTEQSGTPLAFTTMVDDPGYVTASASGGMQVCVRAYPAGGLYVFVDDIDLTGDVPAGATECLWDVGYIDSTGALGWAQSAPETIFLPALLDIATARAVVMPAGAFRTYAVSLSNGQTDIRQSRFVDLRDTLTPSGEYPPDATVVTYTPSTPSDWSSVPATVQAALDDVAAGVVAGSGAQILLYDLTLSGAGQFDTNTADGAGRSGISQSYTDLIAVLEGAGVSQNGVLVWINNDTTTAHYVGQRSIDSGAATGGQVNEIGNIDTSGGYGSLETKIYSYANTSFVKRLFTNSIEGTSPTWVVCWNYYNQTGAVTRLQFFCRTAVSPTNFEAGSRLRIFGVV